MTGPSAFYPMYPADYRAKTHGLSLAEHGAYNLLIMEYWIHGGPIPDDDRLLSRICSCSEAQWRTVSGAVRGYFKPAIINGKRMLTHTRIEEELAHARGIYGKRVAASEAARLAREQAKARINVTMDDQTRVHTVDHVDDQTKDTTQNSELIVPSNEGKEKSISSVRAPKRAHSKNALNGHAKDFDEFWTAFPKKAGKGGARKAYVKALKVADAAVILEGAKAYARARKNEDATFTKWPAGWLTEERWLDELPISEGNAPDPELEAAQKANAEFIKSRGYE